MCLKRARCLLPRWFRVEHLADKTGRTCALQYGILPPPENHALSRLTFPPLFSLVSRFSKDLVLNACPCAGSLAYPFQNQVVNGHTGNLYATYRLINCQEKEPVEPSLAFLFGTDMLRSQHRASPSCFLRSQQTLHLLIQFARRDKEEGENW